MMGPERETKIQGRFKKAVIKMIKEKYPDEKFDLRRDWRERVGYMR